MSKAADSTNLVPESTAASPASEKAILCRYRDEGRLRWAIISATNSLFAPAYWTKDETIAQFRILEQEIRIQSRKGIRQLAEVEAWQKEMQTPATAEQTL